jgi:hypothetical protein
MTSLLSRVRYGVALLSFCLTLPACGPVPNPVADDSPPGFLSVDIKLERRDGQIGPETAGISILDKDVSRTVSPLNRIRILATMGDPQSGIKNIALATRQSNDGQGVLKDNNLNWACTASGELTGILELAAMTPTPSLALPGVQSVSQINVTVDPVGEAPCSTRLLNGFVRVVATNGAGQTAQSGTFLFDFTP